MKNARRDLLIISSGLLTIILLLTAVFLFLSTLQTYREEPRAGSGIFIAIVSALALLPSIIAAGSVLVNMLGTSTSKLTSIENRPAFLKLLANLRILFLIQAVVIAVLELIIPIVSGTQSMAVILFETIAVAAFIVVSELFALSRQWLAGEPQVNQLHSDE